MGLVQGIRDYIGLKRRFARLDTEAVRRLHERGVLELVEFARENSALYRELYHGTSVRSLEDFARLPAVNKQIMMDNFDALNTVSVSKSEAMAFALDKELNRDYLGYYREEFVVGLSSGTSGNKGLYLTPRALTQRAPALFLARSGLPLGLLPFRILFLLRVFSQGFADLAAPGVTLRYRSSMTPPAELISAANDMRANVIMAPPSLLRILAPLAHLLKSKPRRVISYAEVLPSEDKLRLVEAFGCPVSEIYQTSEGQIGSPCRLGNLHINEDLVYVELLDANGHAIGPGERSASMLVTNLVNRAQPLLRYEMNDIVELGQPCPCGSSFRTIAKVIGRDDEVMWLRTASGSIRALFPDLLSRWVITTDDAIREFRVEMISPDLLRITLDLLPDADFADIASRLKERFARECAQFDIACGLDVRFDAISLPSSGAKLRRFYDLTRRA